MANKDMTFCNNRKCPHTDCLRYYNNAPYNTLCSWFAGIPNENNGECSEYLTCVKKGKGDSRR